MGKVKREGASEGAKKVSEVQPDASEPQPTANEPQPDEWQPSAPMVGNYKPIPRFNGHCPTC
jgi:hypothetical protein